MPIGLISTRSAIALAAIALASCASHTPPAELAVANSALQQAEQAGAGQYAPVELGRARDKLGLANDAATKGHEDSAARLASEAEADAKLAAVKAQAVQAEQRTASGRSAAPPATLVPSTPVPPPTPTR